MDYETGSATDPADLISKLGTFAAGDGWTVSSVSGGVVFRKDTVVVGVATDSDEIFLRGAITYNSGAAWDAQTNNAGVTRDINCGAGPFPSYYFWSGAEDGNDYLHVTFEIATGIFRHFIFGEIVKSGSYTGGVYVDGTNWTTDTNQQNFPYNGSSQCLCDSDCFLTAKSHFWADYDSKANNWQPISNYNDYLTTRMVGSGRANGWNDFVNTFGVTSWNLRNIMAPMYYFANRSSSLRSPLGRVPNMRRISLANLVPAEEITIGGDVWKVFPIVQRTDAIGTAPSAIPNSRYLGYAYLMP